MVENALDVGLTEEQFWEMTFAELNRFFDSKRRTEKLRLKEKATMDYIQALLVGRAVSQVISGGSDFPSIEEAYDFIYEDEIQEREQNKQELVNELSVIRFKEFANFHNKKYKEVADNK